MSRINDGCSFWIGDWIIFGEHKFSTDVLATASALTGFSYKTLYNCNYVSRNVPVSLRRENLSWKHHAEVAALEFVEKQKWLALAERHQLSTRHLRACIQAGRLLSVDEFEKATAKTGDVVSLAGLGLKFRHWLDRSPDVSDLSLPAITEQRRNLAPFVLRDQQLAARAEEISHAGASKG